MLIEIRGVQFVNKGAELMLYAVLEQLQLHFPGVRIVLEPGVNSPYLERAKLGTLQKFSLKKGKWDINGFAYRIPSRLRRWMQNQWGIVTEADIDVVLDASGFAYGDQWSSIKIQHLAKELVRSAKQGKRFIFLPQAFGPFTRENDRQALKRALPYASLICAREATSYEYLADLIGSRSGLYQFPDFTNLVSPVVPDGWQDRTNTLLIIPNYNMLSERNQNKAWAEHYVELMVDVICQGRELGLNPVILNHEGLADQAVCEEIANKAGGNVPIEQEAHPLKVKGIIASSKLVVCSRFHGCVSALCQGVPCLGTSWSHKYERLYEEYQLASCLLAPSTRGEELKAKMRMAMDSVELSASARDELKSQSKAMWQKVVSVIGL